MIRRILLTLALAQPLMAQMNQVYVQTIMKEENTGVTYPVQYPRHFLNGAEDFERFQVVYEQVDLSNATVIYNGSNLTTITQSGHTNTLVALDTIKIFNYAGHADVVCQVHSINSSNSFNIRPDLCQSANQPWMTTTTPGVTMNSGAFAWKTDGTGMDPSGTVTITNTGSDTTAKYFIQDHDKTHGSSASGSCASADKYDLHTAACYETHPTLTNVNAAAGVFLQTYYGNATPTCTQSGSIQAHTLSLSSTESFDLTFTTNQGPVKSGTIHFLVCADGAGSGKLAIPTTFPGYRQSFANEEHPILAKSFATANQYGRYTITADGVCSSGTPASVETFLAPTTDGFIKHAGAQKPLAVFHSNTCENMGYTITWTPDADNTTADYVRIFVPDHNAVGGSKPLANPYLVEQTPCAVDPVMTAAGGHVITVGGATRTYQHLYDINTSALSWGDLIQFFNDGPNGSPTTLHEYWELFPPTNTGSFTNDYHTPAGYYCGIANHTTGEPPIQDGAGAVGRSNVGAFTGLGNLMTINGIWSTPSVDNYTGHIQPVHNITVAGIAFLHDNSNPAYFHYAPGDTSRSGATAGYSNGNAVRPFAAEKFAGIGLYASEVANPLFSNCNGDSGWLRNCNVSSLWEGNYLTLYGNTGSFTEHPFYVQDERAVVWLNYMAGSVNGSNGAAYGSLRTGQAWMMWNRGFPAGSNETASVNMGDSTVQDYQKYLDIQNTYGPSGSNIGLQPWDGDCGNGSWAFPLCTPTGGGSPAFGGMNTIAAMQTEHFHSFFYIGNTAKMSTGDCVAGIADTNSGNGLAGQHMMYYNGNNVACSYGGISMLELQRPSSGNTNDFGVQPLAPTLAWVHNNIDYFQNVNPCNSFGVEVNHGKTTMDRVNFGHNIFHTGQYQNGVSVPMTFGNDSFLNCQYGLRRSSNTAQESVANPVDLHMGGWNTAANFIYASSQPFDSTSLAANSALATNAAEAPTYPESLYPNIYNALSATATVTRRLQVDSNNFPTTIGPADTAGAPTLSSITVTPNPANVIFPLTVQLTATCTYSDSSTSNCTSTATWTNGGSTKFHMSTGTPGLVISDAAGTGTATATISAVSGNTTVNVAAAAVQSISIGPGVQIGTGAGSGTVSISK